MVMIMKKIIVLIMLLLLVGCGKSKHLVENEEQPEEEIEQEEVKKLTIEDYQNNSVDELGEVPIMMYHGIHDRKQNERRRFLG